LPGADDDLVDDKGELSMCIIGSSAQAPAPQKALPLAGVYEDA